jgi:hypothetical protein
LALHGVIEHHFGVARVAAIGVAENMLQAAGQGILAGLCTG